MINLYTHVNGNLTMLFVPLDVLCVVVACVCLTDATGHGNFLLLCCVSFSYLLTQDTKIFTADNRFYGTCKLNNCYC